MSPKNELALGAQDSDSTVIRQVSPNVTIVSIPFVQLGLLKTGGRTTIVQLQSGSLAVISPVRLTNVVRNALIATNGTVKYIVAPNLEHYMQIGSWKAEFPDACLIVPEGLPEKCAKKLGLGREIFDIIYTASESQEHISEEFDNEFDVQYIDSMDSHEIVLFHKLTRTVIEADLLFNVPAIEQFSKSGLSATSGVLTKLVSPIFSTTYPATWQKRLAWYILGAKDRVAFAASLQRIYSWDFDRIIPCHGDVVESEAKRVFSTIFEWYLNGENKRL
ncbi:hypothetical protein THARTR1_09674 [Trichoderma harzianum]|uniref:DUF4336 domain-containing protein n=1 Tax=Trichoderma harzianum TaxID=5544 RepID=A0A2K0TVM6_TRIHA|nr:hypothetical protein THARTR1_09674 [Trichoderma harzianum]